MSNSNKKLYDVLMLSEQGGPVPTNSGACLQTTAFGDVHFDTLIIGGHTRVDPTSPGLRTFVADAANKSRRISSICTGAFVLADAGLLADRRVTTHWAFTEAFRSSYPEVYLEENRMFIVDGPVWTAAGNSAGIDLTLCMLERDYGAELARSVARILVVDHQRSGGQSQHSALLAMNPKSDRIQTALAYARRHLRTQLSVESLAEAAGLGARQFNRVFRAETGMSPAKAIESLRLEAAELMISQSQHSIDVIAIETGFGDQERMRRAFIRVFGRPPLAMRRIAQAE